jgi:hypothetical protein
MEFERVAIPNRSQGGRAGEILAALPDGEAIRFRAPEGVNLVSSRQLIYRGARKRGLKVSVRIEGGFVTVWKRQEKNGAV